jgi:collagen type VI alpha
VCKQPLDVLFLVDSSGSIGTTNFHAMRDGMAAIVDNGLNVAPKWVHVAAWTFSGKTNKHNGFGFTKYQNNALVDSGLTSLPYDHGRTATGQALSWTLSTQWPTARKNVSHAMIVITDGKPQDSVSAPAAKARAQGIKVFAIGVGGTYNLASLKSMASQPYSDYVYTMKNFDLKVRTIPSF